MAMGSCRFLNILSFFSIIENLLFVEDFVFHRSYKCIRLLPFYQILKTKRICTKGEGGKVLKGSKYLLCIPLFSLSSIYLAYPSYIYKKY